MAVYDTLGQPERAARYQAELADKVTAHPYGGGRAIHSRRWPMRDCRVFSLVLISLVIVACGGQPETASLEQNKALLRQFLKDIDQSRGSLDFVDKWLTADFQTHFNSPDAMDLAAYRQFMSEALAAFPEMRHEIRYMVAEDDLVAAGITLNMVHTGEYLGIAPTGRSVSVEEMVTVRLRDGKIAEEWVVFDFAALQRQLEAPAAAPR